MSLTPEEQAALAAAAAPVAPAQDPPQESTPAAVQPAPEAAPAPTPAAPSQGSPWDADLASTFEDEATRQKVSEYLGQKVQPHVTRLEQASKAGRELIEALNQDPDATLKELVETIYDEDEAKAILAAFDAEEPVQQVPSEGSDLDPRVQRLIDKQQEEEDRAAFIAEFDRVKAANPDVDLDFDLFVPFVAKAGDFDQAVLDYANYLTRLRGQVGSAQAATENEGPAATAPPALGTGQATGVGSVQTEKEYTTIDEALADTMAEIRAKGETLAPPIPTS